MTAPSPGPTVPLVAPISDAVLYVFIVPLCLIVISIGFCCVYRRWEGIPVMGSDGTKKNRVDPGRMKSNSPRNNSMQKLSGSSYKYIQSAPHR